MSYDLQVERLIDATPEEVFDAFLSGDGMKDWYQIKPDWNVDVVHSDPTVGGTTVVEFGSAAEGWRCREDMSYREIERPNKVVYGLVFSSGDSSYQTTVTATFEDQGGKTLLTISETGYPNAEERDAHQNGWPTFLDRLAAYVASHAEPTRTR